MNFKNLLTFFLNIILPISKYKISGQSMEPALKSGDVVLVNKLSFIFKSPRINEIVAVTDPRDGKILIKRIIKIDNNTYFVEGDNKLASTDSRKFGMIDKNNIIGKVII